MRPILNHKGNFLIPIAIIILILIIAVGGIYLKTKNSLLPQQTSNNKITPIESAIPNTITQTAKEDNCFKEYKNEEHGFAFTYPCLWGNAEEKYEDVITGNELKITFSDLADKMEVGGSSNDQSAERGLIFQDIRDKDWEVYQKACSADFLCQINKIPNKRIISRLNYPDRLIIEDNHSRISQYSDHTFRTEALFDIDNAKISIIGFNFHFIEDNEQFLAKLEQTFPFYVKYARGVEDGVGTFTVTEGQVYNQDIEKMKTLIDKNEFQLPFDDKTKQNLSDFNLMVSSFKFTK